MQNLQSSSYIQEKKNKKKKNKTNKKSLRTMKYEYSCKGDTWEISDEQTDSE